MEKRTEAQWHELAQEYEESGVNQSEWCKSKSINQYTFRGKMSRLRKCTAQSVKDTEKPKESGAPGSAKEKRLNGQVKWVPIITEVSQPKPSDSGILIYIGEITIEVKEDFTEPALMKICKVLKELC